MEKDNIINYLQLTEQKAIDNIANFTQNNFLSRYESTKGKIHEIQKQSLEKFKLEHRKILHMIFTDLIKYFISFDTPRGSNFYDYGNGCTFSYISKPIVMEEKKIRISSGSQGEKTREISIIEYRDTAQDTIEINHDEYDVGLGLLRRLERIGQEKTGKIGETRKTSKNKEADDILLFKFIADMVDLNNDLICKLLPYLLTSYVCTALQNSLFSRGTTAVEDIFDPQDLDIDFTYISRRKKQIKTLSTCYSLKNHKIKELPMKKSHDQRPIPHFVDREKPFHDKTFVEQIFAVFVTIIHELTMIETKDEVLKQRIVTVTNKLDLVYCYFLFLLYVYPDELYGILNEKKDGNIETRMNYFRMYMSDKCLLDKYKWIYDHMRF